METKTEIEILRRRLVEIVRTMPEQDVGRVWKYVLHLKTGEEVKKEE